MAYTYSKIASVTVGSGGVSSIAFLAIPQNYTDLIIKVSARTDRAANPDDTLGLSFNNSGLTYRFLRGSGAAADSGTSNRIMINGSTATASTFANTELYISNYSGSNYKSISADSVGENNATTAYMSINAALWSNSNPIDSIILSPGFGTNFVQYSTATLYGIKAEV